MAWFNLFHKLVGVQFAPQTLQIFIMKLILKFDGIFLQLSDRIILWIQLYL